MKVPITYEKFMTDVKMLYEVALKSGKYDSIYPIPRGGVNVALALQKFCDIPLVKVIGEKTLIVDDLVDSGRTGGAYKNDIAVLYIKAHSPKPAFYIEVIDGWIDFFYEEEEKDIENVVVRMLEHIGENPNREGLLDTPKRVRKMWQEIFGGYKEDPELLFKSVFSSKMDEMVVIKDIPFFSHCEHHVVPFFGKVHIAYIPNGKVLGLSKFARLVDIYARRLQIQEQLTEEIANAIDKHLQPLGVAVIVEARHLCMEMRGVKKPHATTVTSLTRGAFRHNIDTRNEFLSLVK